MTFFLTQIVARLVAVYLAVDCWRTLHLAIVERKITDSRRDLVELLLFDPTTAVFSRDAAPVRYWLMVSLEVLTLFASTVLAIYGWWLPNA